MQDPLIETLRLYQERVAHLESEVTQLTRERDESQAEAYRQSECARSLAKGEMKTVRVEWNVNDGKIGFTITAPGMNEQALAEMVAANVQLYFATAAALLSTPEEPK